MKSIVIEKPNTLVIAERPVPEPLAGEVRVKVKLAGICGSDSHIYRGHNPFAQYPRVIGHEFYGVIEAVGDGVDHSRIGERVSVDPVISCGQLVNLTFVHRWWCWACIAMAVSASTLLCQRKMPGRSPIQCLMSMPLWWNLSLSPHT